MTAPMTTLPEEALQRQLRGKDRLKIWMASEKTELATKINDLRKKAFKSNAADDREAYLQALSSAFQLGDLVVTDALPFLPVQVAVKKLEWTAAPNEAGRDGLWFIAIDLFGKKHEVIKSFNGQKGEGWTYGRDWFPALEAAKAAAQADHEARILSALEPSAARELALEEAAKIAFDISENGEYHGEASVDSASSIYQQGAFEVYEAIRATSSPEHADGGKIEGDGNAAARDVLAERRRQIEVEGWTPQHDDLQTDGKMAQAAACYALNNAAVWPWSISWWKPSDRRRNLVKAGALILAEIERLDRLATHPSGGDSHVE